MEFDLTQGLRDLSRTPPITPLPADPVVRRVRRGRAIRTTAVGLATAAVVIGAAAIVNAAPWQNPPPPAETPAPTVEPTPSETPEPKPSQTPARDALPPIVGLTVDGALLELDPDTGQTLRNIANDPDWSGPLALDRERGHVYLTKDLGWDSAGRPGTVQRVSITDGTVVDIDRGRSPALTRDGRTLAYVSTATTPNREAFGPEVVEAYAVTTLDLDSGATRSVIDSFGDSPARSIGSPAWSADGTRIYVHVGWVDGPFQQLVLAVDPATDVTLDESTMALRPRDLGQSWSWPVVLPDGRLVVSIDAQGPEYEPHWPEPDVAWETGSPDSVDVFAAVVDPTTGAVLERLENPRADVDRVVAAGPDGQLAFIDLLDGGGANWVLYLSGPDRVREIGRGTWRDDDALDEGIAVVAW